MNLSVEISFYPLTEGYEEVIIAFIKNMQNETRIEVVVNGMSTQLFGDDQVLMPLLHKEIVKSLSDQRGIFVMKVGKGTLKLTQAI
jgi:uncharacterized protein YqgV (UPF0045/DUF77 family)